MLNPQGAARLAGVRPGPDVASLAITDEGARAALAAFRLSCPALMHRADASGLTRGADWAQACAAAAGWQLGLEQPEGARIGGVAAVEGGIGVLVQRPDGDRVLVVDPKRGKVAGEIRLGR